MISNFHEKSSVFVEAVICIDMKLTLKQEIELCRDYGEIPKLEIMRKFGLTNAPIIYRILRRHGIPIKSRSDANIWKRQLNVFTEITEEWQAYFLGLVFYDGNLYQNRISISLVEEDFYIVKEICKHLFVKEPHYYRTIPKIGDKRGRPQLCMSVSNVGFSNILRERFGLLPKKSLTCPFPRNIPIQHLNHFIRGYFDGDGCIKKCGREVSMLGSQEFLLAIGTILKLEGIQHFSIRPKGKIYTLGIYNSNAISLFRDFIYRNSSIFLERKHCKFIF